MLRILYPKLMLRRVLFLVAIVFSIGFITQIVEAKSGCCSWHGGVCGCGCCDGTSLSAKCAPYYPQCGGNSTYGTPSYNSYTAPKPLDRCSASGLYQTYIEKKASGEVMESLSSKSWWSKCPQSVRKSVYGKIFTPPPSPDDPYYCSGFGSSSIYNALSEQCECTYGTVMRNNRCVKPPYCGASATYSAQSGQCECNFGYKKQGKSCVSVSCTANSVYNPKSGSCECNQGYLVRDGKCVSAITLCGIMGKYNPNTHECVECDYDSYLKNGDCRREPDCGIGGTFNPVTETCTCSQYDILKNGKCVDGSSSCGYYEDFNITTKKCECGLPYDLRVDGKCQLFRSSSPSY